MFTRTCTIFNKYVLLTVIISIDYNLQFTLYDHSSTVDGVMLIVPVPYLAMLSMDWSKRPSYRKQVCVGSFEHVRGIY